MIILGSLTAGLDAGVAGTIGFGGGGAPTVGTLAKSSDGSVGQVYTATITGGGTVQMVAIDPASGASSDIVGATGASPYQFTATTAQLGKRITFRAVNGSNVPIPYGRVLTAPILLTGFDDTTGFVFTNNPVPNPPTFDTVNKVQGTGSMLIGNGGVTGGPTATKTAVAASMTAADIDVVAYAVFADAQPEFQNVTALDLRLGRGGTYYNSISIAVAAANLTSGSTTVTWSSGETVQVGLPVTGTGIPASTTVLIGGTNSAVLSNAATLTQTSALTFATSTFTSESINDTVTGLSWRSYPPTSISTLNGLAAGQIDARMIVTSSGGTASPYAGQMKVDAMVAKAGGIPTLVPTVDDGRASIKDWLIGQMVARQLPLTFFCPTRNMNGTTFMAASDVIAMAATGYCDIAIDGNSTDQPMTSLASTAAVLADIDLMWSDLAAWGLDTPAKFHLCYPNGTVRVAGAKVQIASVSATVGQATITWGSGETVTAATTMMVAGLNVPKGTYVVTGGTGSATLSNPVGVTQTLPMSFTDTSGAFHTGKLQAALKGKGIRTARQTNSGTMHTRFGMGDRALLFPGESMSLATGDLMKSWVEEAKLKKATKMSYGHNFVTSIVSGLDTLQSETLIYLDYLASERQAGRIEVLSVSQLWARDGGSSLPNI